MALEQLPKLPSQSTLIERIKYQLSVGTPFVFLSGAQGAGKTVICEKLISELDENYLCAYVPVEPKMPIEKVREVLLRQLSSSTIFNADDKLIGTVQRINFQHQKVLIVIDNIPNVLDEFLLELAEIYQIYIDQGLFSIIVTADTKWCEVKARSFKEAEITTIEMDIPQLNSAEVGYVFSYYYKLLSNNQSSGVKELRMNNNIKSCAGNPYKVRLLVEDMIKSENNKDQDESPVASNSENSSSHTMKSSSINKASSNKSKTNNKKVVTIALASLAAVAVIGVACFVFSGKNNVEPDVVAKHDKVETSSNSTSEKTNENIIENKTIIDSLNGKAFEDKKNAKTDNNANPNEVKRNTLDFGTLVDNDTQTSTDEVVNQIEDKPLVIDENAPKPDVELVLDDKTLTEIENKADKEIKTTEQNVKEQKDSVVSSAPALPLEENGSKKDNNTVANVSSQKENAKKETVKKDDVAKVDTKVDSKKQNTTVQTDNKSNMKQDKKQDTPAKPSKTEVAQAKTDDKKVETPKVEPKKDIATKKENSANVDSNVVEFDLLPNNNWSVQIGTSSKESGAKKIAKQVSGQTWVLYRAQKKDYIVMYGNFANKAEATKTIANLPDNIKKTGPWQKQIGKVKAELKK